MSLTPNELRTALIDPSVDVRNKPVDATDKKPRTSRMKKVGVAAGILVAGASTPMLAENVAAPAVDKVAEIARAIDDRLGADRTFNPEQGNPEVTDLGPASIEAEAFFSARNNADASADSAQDVTVTDDTKGNISYTYPTSEQGTEIIVQDGDAPYSIASRFAEPGTEKHNHYVAEITAEAENESGIQPGEVMHIGDEPVKNVGNANE
jgi:hypothetical protein